MADKQVSFRITAKDRTAATFSKVKSSLLSVNKAALGLSAAIAGAAGIAGVGAMAKSAMNTADRIHKLNIRLGASTEALSQYRHVADMSGVSFDTLTMGWQRMTRRVAEAANDTGEARGALEELGISAVELTKLKPEEQFEVLADAIKGVEEPADRVRLAMKLFDSEGVSLIQMMEGGSEGLRQMRNEADKMGMTMSKEMVTKVATANDAVAKITNRFKGMSEVLVGQLAPHILTVANTVGDWIDRNRELIGQGMKQTLEALAVAGRELVPVFQLWVKWLKFVAQVVGWVVTKIKALLDAFGALEALSAGWEKLQAYFQVGDYAPANANAAVAGGGEMTAREIYESGGGEPFDNGEWNGSGGTTVNINTQVTRNDAVAIVAEAQRQGGRL